MYEVNVTNYVNTVDRSWKFLEWAEACDVFVTAMECEDCKEAFLINAMTGELYADYENGVATVYSLPEEDRMEE